MFQWQKAKVKTGMMAHLFFMPVVRILILKTLKTGHNVRFDPRIGFYLIRSCFCVQLPQVTPSGSPVLPSLSVLRLGSNRLASLPEGSFSACPHLTELYLDNNAIKSLNDHTFSGLSKLEVSLVVLLDTT